MQFVDRMEADRELYYQKFFYDCLDDDEKTLQGKRVILLHLGHIHIKFGKIDIPHAIKQMP